MQLNTAALDRDESHNQISNSNRLTRNKVNLVELHDGEATLVEDKTTFPRLISESRHGW